MQVESLEAIVSDPAILLGVGCQKGGTTWLFDWLAGHPQVDLFPHKEMHVLDALFVPSMRSKYHEVMDALARHQADPDASPIDPWLPHLGASMMNLELYFDHFHYRLLRDPGVRLTGEITPGYAGLPAAVFRFVRNAMAQRGVATKVLFVMRDPVDRCHSQLRMHRASAPAEERREPVHAQLLRMHAQHAFAFRTRYDLTLAQLDEALPPESLHVVLYETLFTEDGLASLLRFLGLDPHPAELRRRVFASTPADPLPDRVVRTVAATYAPVYAEARARFGDAHIEAHWPSARSLVAV